MCDGQYPQPLVIHPFANRRSLPAQFGRERTDGSGDFGVGADLEHLLHGPLGDNLPFAGMVLDDHRHAAAGKVERDFVHLVIAVLHRFQVEIPHMGENRLVHQIFQPCLEKAVEIGVAEDALPVVIASIGVDVLFQDDLVAGQRSGLVGAEDVHGSEILDGVQILDDDLFPGHRNRPFGEVGRDDHGEHLGGQPDGNRHGKDEGVQPVALRDPVDHEDKRHHDEHEADEQHAYLCDALVESRGGPVSGDGPGDGSQIGVVPGLEYDGGGRAADHVRTHVADVVQFHDAALCVSPATGLGALLDRFGFARQRGLADEEILGLGDPHVGRNHVARGKHDDVSRNELLDGNLRNARLAAPHRAGVLDQSLERLA